MIPKIIHQTWKTEEIPPPWQPLVLSWRDMHPDWDYRLWTNETGYDFVAQVYPDFLPFYESFSYDIQRADALRYLVLHHFGGLYADLDFECLQCFDSLLDLAPAIFAWEPRQHAHDFGLSQLLGNALMLSIPGHPFLATIIQHLQANPTSAVSHNDVLVTTGPIMVDRVRQAYRGNDLSMLPSEVFYALASRSGELRMLQQNAPEASQIKQQLLTSGSYAIHYWSNSWVHNLTGHPLHNPCPHNIPGYTFFPGLNSLGADLCNGGRDISQLAKTCSATEGGVAFNTDGFVKSRLLPREQWNTLPNPNGNEGLYVKDVSSEE
ncbi:MAG: glycosyltransferase [Planctomycetota bacterium]